MPRDPRRIRENCRHALFNGSERASRAALTAPVECRDPISAAAQFINRLAIFLDEFSLAMHQHAYAARGSALGTLKRSGAQAHIARSEDEMRP
jgi:hypothetical protein